MNSSLCNPICAKCYYSITNLIKQWDIFYTILYVLLFENSMCFAFVGYHILYQLGHGWSAGEPVDTVLHCYINACHWWIVGLMTWSTLIMLEHLDYMNTHLAEIVLQVFHISFDFGRWVTGTSWEWTSPLEGPGKSVDAVHNPPSVPAVPWSFSLLPSMSNVQLPLLHMLSPQPWISVVSYSRLWTASRCFLCCVGSNPLISAAQCPSRGDILIQSHRAGRARERTPPRDKTATGILLLPALGPTASFFFFFFFDSFGHLHVTEVPCLVGSPSKGSLFLCPQTIKGN